MRACLAILIPATVFGQAVFRGTLDPELVPLSEIRQSQEMKPATEENRGQLPGWVKPSGRILLATIRKLPVVLIEPDTLVFGGRKYTLDQRRATVTVPLAGPAYLSYPMQVEILRREEKVLMTRSLLTMVRGWVEIDGHTTMVEFEFDPENSRVDLDRGWQAVDLNSDGKIDVGPQSLEFIHAKGSRPIFRIGDRFVSARSIDLIRHQVEFESRLPSDYTRIELRQGASFPDFAFTDLGGASRKLSEFRGKYILLDFWGAWCVPCVAEIPELAAVYERFHERGFEILGMDTDEDPETARRMIAQKHIAWPQALFSSIREIIDQRLGIGAYPTYVLLDPGLHVIASTALTPASLPERLESLTAK